jgi:hypothetical protein
MIQPDTLMKTFLTEGTGEYIYPAEAERIGQQQAKVIRLLDGEDDVVWKSASQVEKESIEQRERVRGGVRNGAIGMNEFSKAVDMLVDRNSIERSKNAYRAVVAATEVFVLKPDDDRETYLTKRRRVGILMSAVEGRFTGTDPVTGESIDLREDVVRSPKKTMDLLLRFTEKFHSPFDFGETANTLLDRVRQQNGPEKAGKYKEELENVLSTIYGDKYEYYKCIKGLFDEAFSGTN